MTRLQTIARSFFWVVPFISFFMGYQLVRVLTHTEAIYVPSVVGLQINDAIRILSADQLNVRILAETEDPDLGEGLILSQTPEQGKLVKPHQSIFLVISRKPVTPRAPRLIGLPCAQAETQAHQSKIRFKKYSFESSYPQGICIAQSITADRDVTSGTMTIYCSTGPTQLRIFPKLLGKSVEEVRTFFGPYDISVRVEGAENDLVSDQRPVAGSLVDLRKPLVVELTTTAGTHSTLETPSSF